MLKLSRITSDQKYFKMRILKVNVFNKYLDISV